MAATSEHSESLALLRVLEILSVIAFAIVLAFMIRTATTIPYDIVVDPAVPYSPDEVKRQVTAGFDAWFPAAPGLVWTAVGLLALLVIGAIVRITDQGDVSFQSVGALAVAVVLAGITLLIGADLTEHDKSDTFSTWAEQRYGIELYDYPTSQNGFFGDPSVDTRVVITLDDGQKVRMVGITDARGRDAYIIAPAEGQDAELEVIAEN